MNQVHLNQNKSSGVIPNSEVENKPERDVERSVGFGNTPVGLKIYFYPLVREYL